MTISVFSMSNPETTIYLFLTSADYIAEYPEARVNMPDDFYNFMDIIVD